MKFILNFDDSNEDRLVDYEVEGTGRVSLDSLISGLFCVMDGITKGFLENHPDAHDDLYEHYNGVFDLFLRRVFPEPPEGYFELSDAALLMAQDQIIEEADKKGISFQEALDKYEKRAKEYLRQKKEGRA